MSTLHIYTDGSCLGNPGKGGASAVFVKNDEVMFSRVFREKMTTNNRMELVGVILGVEFITIENVIIYTDSNYVLKAITEWVNNWVKNDWKKRDGKPVLNCDLWKQLLKISNGKNIQYKKVKAHNGDKFNELADYLAVSSASKNYHKK